MTNSDFTKNAIVNITPAKSETNKKRNKLPKYDVEFLRRINQCPDCGSGSFTKKRSSSRWIFAIVNDAPANCRMIRKEYNCKNVNCPRYKHCFYNTHGHEDGLFDGKGCTYHFVYFILEKWLSNKTLSFLDIEKEYDVSRNEADTWSFSLRKEFDAHFTVPAMPTMVFYCFTDRDNIKRGFVVSPARKGSFHLLSFIDDYSPIGLQRFSVRIEGIKQVSKVFYYGTQEIGSELQSLFGVPTVHLSPVERKMLKLWEADKLQRDIATRVNKKDSYDSIVIKFLYDSHVCKDRILAALRKTAKQHGAIRIDFKSGKGPALFSMFHKKSAKELLQQAKELPEVSNYYATYK